MLLRYVLSIGNNLQHSSAEKLVYVFSEGPNSNFSKIFQSKEQNCPELVTQIEVGGEVGTLFQLIYQPALNLLRKIATKWIEKPPEVSVSCAARSPTIEKYRLLLSLKKTERLKRLIAIQIHQRFSKHVKT